MRCTLCRVMPMSRAIPATGSGVAEHRAEHLPPRGGQPGRSGQFLGQLEELAVEFERGQRDPGQQGRRAGVRHADISS